VPPATPQPLIVVSNAAVDEHDTGDHPEEQRRTMAAMRGLEVAGLQDVEVRESRPATVDELVAVHSPEYVASLEEYCMAGGGRLDQDTPIVYGSWRTALHAAGSGLLALELLDAGEADTAFVVARPPGHHARPQRGMGFCLFNNVAVAAASLANRGERVAILDWDVHHGNGTQEAFWDDDRVLFISLHQYPYYPGTGSVRETGGPAAPGATINLPVPPNATGDLYLEAFDTLIAPAVRDFRATKLLISAGFDAHRDDPLADVALSAGDYADLTRRCRELAPDGKLAMFLEGGYDLQALCDSVGSVLSEVCGTGYRPEGATNGGPGREMIRTAIENHRVALW
jgi:acetoin utilization deacetylase AcuC-like enzyme